jgi:glutamine amidotransferase
MNKVGIIDYGAANIENVIRAVKNSGYSYLLVSNPEDMKSCNRAILPGVGAFPFGMKRLAQTGLATVLQQSAKQGFPILGICLGMQLLFNDSAEFGQTPGLSLIEGSVLGLPSNTKEQKVPRFGWYPVYSTGEFVWKKLGLNLGGFYYFAHSFYASPNSQYPKLTSEHGSLSICAGVAHNNIFGLQFHPEKSGPLGHKIITSFLELKT